MYGRSKLAAPFALVFFLGGILACGGAPQRAETTPPKAPGATQAEATEEPLPLSRAEERWIIELAQELDSDVQPEPAEVLEAAKRIANAPGILIPLCPTVIGPYLDSESDFDFMSPYLVAFAAALLDTPKLGADLPAAASRALASIANAYRVQKASTGVTYELLEPLVMRSERGEIPAWVKESWDRCPKSMAVVRALEKHGDDAVLVAPDSPLATGDKPWGEPVSNAEHEAQALTTVRRIAEGTAKADMFFDTFAIGPALYGQLLKLDAESGREDFANLGTAATSIMPSGDAVVEFEMRSYSEGEQEKLVEAPSLRTLSGSLATANARAATEAERQAWYALIPFEIQGKPVTILELGEHDFVVFFEDGKLTWMDLLSGYTW